MNTQHQLKLVQQFMTIGGQAVNSTTTYQSTKIADFRTALIEEEIYGKDELIESIQRDDLVGIVDGLCDILYVTYGAIATYGISMNDFKLFVREPGSTGKLMFKHDAHYLERALTNAFQQYQRGVEVGDMTTISRGLTGIILEVNRIAEACNVDIIGGFEEVQASNMSKFCTSNYSANLSITERIAANDKNSEFYVGAKVVVLENNGKSFFIIQRASDGKILKGIDFFEPDLTQFA